MIKYILCDIEGTTTPVEFVYETLFPYFKDNLYPYYEAHAEDETFLKVLEDLKFKLQEEENLDASFPHDLAKLLEWADLDRKDSILKTIQGMVWKDGYTKGELKGEIFLDAYQCLQTWHQSGIKLGIYSSGSVEAQKLLFSNSNFGDLTGWFSNHFDTHIGGKRKRRSYEAIQEDLNIPANQILFLSDIEEELDPAQKIGFHTTQILRLPIIREFKHPTAVTFHDVDLLRF
jgi:enolase-phosphatase E1